MTNRQIACMCQGHHSWIQTPEHAEYTEAKQLRMKHRANGPVTASAERAQAWFEDKWNAWQARRILDELPESEVAQAERLLTELEKGT